MTIPGTNERVKRHTAKHINDRIERMTLWNLDYYGAHLDEIDQRLRELDREWDIERTLETQAASVTLFGVLMGTLVSRRFFILPAIVGGFLLQHALQGWCPPVPVFRRLGIRTQGEIEMERYALKALRGDFNQIQPVEGEMPRGRVIMDAIRRPFERMVA